MPKRRQNSGDETTLTLLNWTKDSKTAERLAGGILQLENYDKIDPSHPLGGRDNKKDLTCSKDNIKFIVGVYFPRKQMPYNAIEKKLLKDFLGVAKNNVDSMIFFTNQRISISQRKKLISISKNEHIQIYHNEKISLILNSPSGYGLRLEYLDIELSKTEQLSYFAEKDKEAKVLRDKLSEILNFLKAIPSIPSIPNERISEFKNTLEYIVGTNPFSFYGNSMIDRLRVPLNELLEFEKKLLSLTGDGYIYSYNNPIQRLRVPLDELEKFQTLLFKIVGANPYIDTMSPIHRLKVPLQDLDDYNLKLDNAIAKILELKRLSEK